MTSKVNRKSHHDKIFGIGKLERRGIIRRCEKVLRIIASLNGILCCLSLCGERMKHGVMIVRVEKGIGKEIEADFILFLKFLCFWPFVSFSICEIITSLNVW